MSKGHLDPFHNKQFAEEQILAKCKPEPGPFQYMLVGKTKSCRP